MTTIFAPASGVGRAAVTIIRLSGPECQRIVERLVERCPPPHQLRLRAIKAADGQILDRGMVCWFPGPKSYTGEDAAELHLHGGRAVLRAVSYALIEAGARPAEPGEFTRRAFLHGQMDLLEAEGVADLIAADTEGQRRQALQTMDGAQSALLTGWGETLKRLLAWQEALIDFPEEDLPATVEASLLSSLDGLIATLADALRDVAAGGRVRAGVVTAVTGPPNVGKSSLVNLLARRDVAITSSQPGTTRDALEVWIELVGIPVCLIDTAGLREPADELEAEGIRRAREKVAGADLVIELLDATSPDGPAGDATRKTQAIRVANKIDLAAAPLGWIGVSARTGEGLENLLATMSERVGHLTDTGSHPALSQARHAAALLEARLCLEKARNAAPAELRAEELRLAMGALGRISGRVGVEDVLDAVFGAFCIGK